MSNGESLNWNIAHRRTNLHTRCSVKDWRYLYLAVELKTNFLYNNKAYPYHGYK